MDKYLERDAVTGRMRERISADASAGVADAGRIVALNGAGELDGSMLPAGVGQNSIQVVAFEALAADDLVEIFDDGGVPSARLASASDLIPQPACGFVKAAVLVAGNAVVLFEGRVAGQVGLVPGQRVYLSDVTAGGITTTPVVGTDKLHQFVGKATSTTEFNFEADDSIVLA